MDATAFESLAAKKDAFLGASALDERWAAVLAQQAVYFRQNPLGGAFCTEARDRLIEWAHAFSSVHLATFPIG